jgi:hypothetical protein
MAITLDTYRLIMPVTRREPSRHSPVLSPTDETLND